MATPELSFVNDNMLAVDGKHLRGAYGFDRRKEYVSPEDLETILTIGGAAVRLQIEQVYGAMRSRHPEATIELPSIWTIHMAGSGLEDRFYSDLGLANNTGISSDPAELKEKPRQYWSAIEQAGFVPEARSSFAKPHAGAWLLARIDPTPR